MPPAWNLDAVRSLASPVPEDRVRAVEVLYAQGLAWTVRSSAWFVTQLDLPGIASRIGEAPAQPEDLAQKVWRKLAAHFEREPLLILVTAESPGGIWTAYVRQAVRNAALDEYRRLIGQLRRLQGDSGQQALLIKHLKAIQRQLTDPTEKLWLQEMIDTARRDLDWRDHEYLAQQVGVDPPRMQEFVKRVLDELSARLQPPRVPDVGRLRELWAAMGAIAMKHYVSNTKVYLVARAMFETDPSDGLFRGKHINQERVLEKLHELGQQWYAPPRPRAGLQRHLPHEPGYKAAWNCKHCMWALYQACSRVLQTPRKKEPAFNDLWQAFCQERDVGSVQQGGTVGQDEVDEFGAIDDADEPETMDDDEP